MWDGGCNARTVYESSAALYALDMRFLALPTRATLIACAVGLGVALASAPALAVGEEITDVRVMGNQRTEESTVRSVAGVSIGDTLETGTLDLVRERLNTTGLFSDVNVWWEQYKTGVRVNIAVKDKFPWAPVPTGSWAANNRAFGLLFVHGNLFGRGKQLLLGGRHRHRRFGRRARLPRSVVLRQLDLLAAARQRPAPGHPGVLPGRPQSRERGRIGRRCSCHTPSS